MSSNAVAAMLLISRTSVATVCRSHCAPIPALLTGLTRFSASTHHDFRASPSAKNLIAIHGLDPTKIPATGKRKMIMKEDVLLFLDQQKNTKQIKPGTPTPIVAKATPLPATNTQKYDEIPVTTIRKVIAERLTLSKTTMPHLYITTDINIDEVLKARASINASGASPKISVNDFFIKAVSLALKEVKDANVSYHDGFVRQHHCVDVSVAVATDRGLITPIVKNSDQKSIADIASDVQRLASKAREGRLLPEEFQGGTFSISNLGMFGIAEFSAVLNPPQAGILAVGQGRQEVVDVDPLTMKPIISNVVSVRLSCDERAISHDIAAKLLDSIKQKIISPQGMLL